jgi:hypothetical protein
LIVRVFLRLALVVGPALLVATTSSARDGVGVRIGLSRSPDQFVVGAQGEVGPVVGSAFFSPSLDFGFGDDTTTTLMNADLRWYLLPLPETGIRFYGQAGPAIVVSPDTELGLSLVAGADIPMKRRNRYNIEMRFGLGDVPDLKIVFSIVFGR